MLKRNDYIEYNHNLTYPGEFPFKGKIVAIFRLGKHRFLVVHNVTIGGFHVLQGQQARKITKKKWMYG